MMLKNLFVHFLWRNKTFVMLSNILLVLSCQCLVPSFAVPYTVSGLQAAFSRNKIFRICGINWWKFTGKCFWLDSSFIVYSYRPIFHPNTPGKHQKTSGIFRGQSIGLKWVKTQSQDYKSLKQNPVKRLRWSILSK